jgi:hypothetical protein
LTGPSRTAGLGKSSRQIEVCGSVEDDGGAAVEQPEPAREDFAERPLAGHRQIAPGIAGLDIDMRLVGLELVPLVMEQVGVAQQQQLAGLVVVTATVRLDREPGAVLERQFALGTDKVEHARLAGRLHRPVGGQRERPVLRIGADIERPHHLKLAAVAPRGRLIAALDAWPSRQQPYDAEGQQRQHHLHELHEVGIAAACVRHPARMVRHLPGARRGGWAGPANGLGADGLGVGNAGCCAGSDRIHGVRPHRPAGSHECG